MNIIVSVHDTNMKGSWFTFRLVDTVLTTYVTKLADYAHSAISFTKNINHRFWYYSIKYDTLLSVRNLRMLAK